MFFLLISCCTFSFPLRSPDSYSLASVTILPCEFVKHSQSAPISNHGSLAGPPFLSQSPLLTRRQQIQPLPQGGALSPRPRVSTLVFPSNQQEGPSLSLPGHLWQKRENNCSHTRMVSVNPTSFSLDPPPQESKRANDSTFISQVRKWRHYSRAGIYSWDGSAKVLNSPTVVDTNQGHHLGVPP